MTQYVMTLFLLHHWERGEKNVYTAVHYTETLFISVRFSLETPFLLEMSFLWPSQANIIISVYYVDHQMFSRALTKDKSREQTFRKVKKI